MGFSWVVTAVALGIFAGPELVEVSDWDRYVRVSEYDPGGFPCYDRTDEPRKEVRRLYFKTPLYRQEDAGDYVRVSGRDFDCYAPRKVVAALHSTPFVCPGAAVPQALTSLAALLDRSPPDKAAGTAAGPLFPTFYQVAREGLYGAASDDDSVTLRDNDGDRIARVSKAFQRALLRQGTGVLEDGRVLNVGRKTKSGRRFIVLPEGTFGLGISGYHLYPYRSAAVDFDYLCDRLGGIAGCTTGNVERRDRKVSRKNRKALVGMLLHVQRLDGILLDDGSRHDGFVCAVDIGGGIKNDRIDLFVGADAAGNPYYPPCRRDNALIRAGIESLIPSDWRRFEPDDEGTLQRAIATEYRTVSPHKGLDITAFPDVRCRSRAERPSKEGK